LHSCSSSRKGVELSRMIDNKNITILDSTLLNGINFYSGYENSEQLNRPVFYMKASTSSKPKSLIISRTDENQYYSKLSQEIRGFQKYASSIVVQEFVNSAGVNSCIGFYYSGDFGLEWNFVESVKIDSKAEGIRSIQLLPDNVVRVDLFKLSKPNIYSSDDNCKTWKSISK